MQLMAFRAVFAVVLLSTLLIGGSVAADPSRGDVEHALKKATDFFRTEVTIQGGYLWRYSSDLRYREGEGAASAETAWVQPPGTPSVGEAFLTAYEATGESSYLDAVRETAHALVSGQLESGGWDYRIEFGDERGSYRYHSEELASVNVRLRNVTTLDDNTTQSALRFLMHADRALEFRDSRIAKCVEYALERLLAAQYPNGAWPQRFSEPPEASKFPVLRASFPAEYPAAFPDVDYRSFYTFNDNTLADMITTMFEAGEIYKNDRYTQAAKRAGDFILLAQLPEPQPAWAQQYNAEMHPAWARKFEPASVTGGESQGVIRILMMLYQETGDRKYLEPIPRALDYLERSALPDGQLARFYELRTNRPLYFTTQYVLTYDDGDLPTHYGFKVRSQVGRLRADFRELEKANWPIQEAAPQKPRLTEALVQEAAGVVDALDERGAWVTEGRLRTIAESQSNRVIETQRFIQNVETLCDFLRASP